MDQWKISTVIGFSVGAGNHMMGPEKKPETKGIDARKMI